MLPNLKVFLTPMRHSESSLVLLSTWHHLQRGWEVLVGTVTQCAQCCHSLQSPFPTTVSTCPIYLHPQTGMWPKQSQSRAPSSFGFQRQALGSGELTPHLMTLPWGFQMWNQTVPFLKPMPKINLQPINIFFPAGPQHSECWSREKSWAWTCSQAPSLKYAWLQLNLTQRGKSCSQNSFMKPLGRVNLVFFCRRKKMISISMQKNPLISFE